MCAVLGLSLYCAAHYHQVVHDINGINSNIDVDILTLRPRSYLQGVNPITHIT